MMSKKIGIRIVAILCCLIMGISVFSGFAAAETSNQKGEVKRTGYYNWCLVYDEKGNVEGAKIINYGAKVDGDENPIEEFKTPTHVIFPETIEGYPVVEIDSLVFDLGFNYFAVETVTIPQYVKRLDAGNWPHGVGTFIVDEKNEYYSAQDGVLYNKDKTELLVYPKKCKEDFAIPESVKKIGPNAFWYTDVKNVTFPKALEEIGAQAFYCCKKMQNVQLHGAVKIGEKAFYETNIKNITIPENSVVSGDAFMYCRKLKKITMEKGAKWEGDIQLCETKITSFEIQKGTAEIPANAFYNCKKLKTVTIPRSVHAIHARAFKGCKNLKKINYQGSRSFWRSIAIANWSNICLNYIDIHTKTSVIKKQKVKLTKKLHMKIAEKRVSDKKGLNAHVEWSTYKRADGYQVKVFSGKSKKVKKFTDENYPVGDIYGLKKNKNYKVKVRYYITIAGKTYYSKWSKAKKLA